MTGIWLAISAAALFGVSPVFAKIIVGEVSPFLLAGLLYLGSGFVLLLGSRAQGLRAFAQIKKLSLSHKRKLIGAILSGGVIAPVLLTYGLKFSSAFEVSVLLNLETVATTLLAYFIFHEHVGPRVWIGKIVLLFGAVLMLINPGARVEFSLPGLLIMGACFFWGLDNNLTRDVDDLPPAILAGTKGLIAGSINTFLAVILGKAAIGVVPLVSSLVLGALSYGLSLVLFVKALRALGTSRTSTYFATGPIFGMILAIALLGEHPPFLHWFAAALMGLGAFVLYREVHSHEHTHDELTHSYMHVSDEHHEHEHDGSEGPEPHEHSHQHVAITHEHRHLPDIHHRHSH